MDKKAVEELRLNVENLNEKDKDELEEYVELESSKKMKYLNLNEKRRYLDGAGY